MWMHPNKSGVPGARPASLVIFGWYEICGFVGWVSEAQPANRAPDGGLRFAGPPYGTGRVDNFWASYVDWATATGPRSMPDEQIQGSCGPSSHTASRPVGIV